MAIELTWDPGKARRNAQKHGVSFEEAVTVFIDPLARIHDDSAHSLRERREILVGHSGGGRLPVVSFTERGTVVRIINARRATRHEQKDYEASHRP